MGFRVGRRGSLRRAADPRRYLVAVMVVGLMALGALGRLDSAAAVPGMATGSGKCRITSVVDGDTVRLWCPAKGRENARLMGFDTPEVFSPKCASELRRGRAATKALKRTLRRAEDVKIVRQGYDRYGRVLARVWVDGTPVSQVMIRGGHARPYGGARRKGWCG